MVDDPKNSLRISITDEGSPASFKETIVRLLSLLTQLLIPKKHKNMIQVAANPIKRFSTIPFKNIFLPTAGLCLYV